MTREELKERTLTAIYELASKDATTIENTNDDAFCYSLFIKVFGKVPHVMYFFDELSLEEEENDDNWDAEGEYHPKGKINIDATTEKIIKNFECYVHVWKSYKFVVTNEFILFRGTLFNINEKKSQKIIDCIVDELGDKANLKFVSVDSNGRFNVNLMPIKQDEVDLDTNYNDDLPYERIEDIIKSENSALILLHGDPGTGKSFLIRKLITDNPNIKFYWLDSSMFSQINSTAFMDFLFKCKDSVFILEDCEMVLKDRGSNYNTLITPILNISDGMLGDSLNLKFICTFNDSLTNVDSALLRKGRLKLKYEFKKLTEDKIKHLFEKFNIDDTPKEMALCDVFNYQEDNGVKTEKKIGF